MFELVGNNTANYLYLVRKEEICDVHMFEPSKIGQAPTPSTSEEMHKKQATDARAQLVKTIRKTIRGNEFNLQPL